MIYLRAESYANEYRVALVPDDIAKLVSKGYSVVVESASSPEPCQRIFPDSAYSSAGALVTTEKWYSYGFAQGLFAPGTGQFVVGLKELDGLDKLSSHTHIYFSHSYKGQKGSEEVLSAFFRGGSILYDLEYFRNPDGSRSLAFGKYAGMVGAAVGLLQMKTKGDICKLKPWKSLGDMMGEVGVSHSDYKILIIGNGRCSSGVQTVLKDVGCDFDVVGREGVENIYEYDIVFNCIALSVDYTDVWMRKGDVVIKDILVVDISCDYTKPNNPLSIYSEGTSAEKPVLHVNDRISVIAIDNLPSLLPYEASVEFSGLLTDLLLRYGDACWKDNLAVYTQQVSRFFPLVE